MVSKYKSLGILSAFVVSSLFSTSLMANPDKKNRTEAVDVMTKTVHSEVDLPPASLATVQAAAKILKKIAEWTEIKEALDSKVSETIFMSLGQKVRKGDSATNNQIWSTMEPGNPTIHRLISSPMAQKMFFEMINPPYTLKRITLLDSSGFFIAGTSKSELLDYSNEWSFIHPINSGKPWYSHRAVADHNLKDYVIQVSVPVLMHDNTIGGVLSSVILVPPSDRETLEFNAE